MSTSGSTGSAARLPWFKMHAGEFLATTAGMSASEAGAFSRLLCYYWLHGDLPKEDRAIARLAGVYPTTWAKMRDKILAAAGVISSGVCGEISPRQVGKIPHGMCTLAALDQQRDEAQKSHEKRAEMGRKGGRARAANMGAGDQAGPGSSA